LYTDHTKLKKPLVVKAKTCSTCKNRLKANWLLLIVWSLSSLSLQLTCLDIPLSAILENHYEMAFVGGKYSFISFPTEKKRCEKCETGK